MGTSIGLGLGMCFADGATAPSTPATILGSKLKLWLDSDLGITLNGSAVSAWGDQSGSGNNVTQATGASQPLYTAGALNGHAVVDFDGTDDFLGGPAISAILTANAWTAWIVLRTDAIDTNSGTVFGNDGILTDGAGQFWGFHLKSAPTAHVYQFDGSTDTDSTSYATGAYNFLRFRHNGTSIFVKHGTNAESTGVASGSITNLTNALRIGRGATGVTSLDGKIANILVCNAVTSAGEHTNVEAYLTARYGL